MTIDDTRSAQILNTFNTVAPAYGRGTSRFFHASGEVMVNLLNLQGHESVLDVASGTGATALPLARKLPRGRVTAIDFSSGMLAQAIASARDCGLSNLVFERHDMTQLPFDQHSFDHATCSFGLFFVDDMGGTLKHIANTVKPGGTVLISGFYGESFEPMAQLFLDRMRSYGVDVPDKLGWRRMSEMQQLNQVFTDAGFEHMKIEQRSLGYFIDLDGWWEIVWNAGFRGMVEQLGDRIEEFRQAHLDELRHLCGEQGLWLTIDVNYAYGVRSS
jgi:ubiquinone/menaquinone biosynthesis C-methylase UbiE